MNRYYTIKEDIVTRKTFNLQKEYDKYNRELFGGKLPKIPLKWVTNKGIGGKVVLTGQRGRPETYKIKYLAMSDFLEEEEEGFRAQFLHELVHVYVDFVAQFGDPNPHGHFFQHTCIEIGKKAGIQIPLKNDDITHKKVSSKIKAKTLLVVLIYLNGKQHGIQLFPKDKLDDVMYVYKEFPKEDWFKRKKVYLKLVMSNDKELMKYPVKRKVDGGLGGYEVSDEYFNALEKNKGITVGEVK